MTATNVVGIDPHQEQFTVGIVDANGVELDHATFPNSAAGFAEAITMLATDGVERVGIEGSAGWGAHVAIAVAAAGFDAREVPAQRTALQRRARRLAKTDAIDAVAAARALPAEPTLGPVQALEVYDPLVAKIEAVLEHRRALVEARTLMLHYAGDQLAKLPVEIRDQLGSTGKLESRLRRLETIDTTNITTASGAYRLEWLRTLLEQDRAARREIRRLERLIDDLLDEHGTTLRDEPGIGPIAAATLVCEVGDPHRFGRESRFARWCGTGAVALSSGEGGGRPVRHRLDYGGNRRVNSVLYIASVTQQRDHELARVYIDRKLAEGKTRREARRAHKRHLANRVIRRMWRDETNTPTSSPDCHRLTRERPTLDGPFAALAPDGFAYGRAVVGVAAAVDAGVVVCRRQGRDRRRRRCRHGGRRGRCQIGEAAPTEQDQVPAGGAQRRDDDRLPHPCLSR